MKRKELYEKTVDILLDAYNKGTLLHFNCYACAVGNIIAANMGKEFVKDNSEEIMDFHKLYWEGYSSYDNICSRNGSVSPWFAHMKHTNESQEGLDQLLSTGYTIEELTSIENTFEKNSHYDKGSNTIGGLKAVLILLQEIHEGSDEQTEENNIKFEKISQEKYSLTY